MTARIAFPRTALLLLAVLGSTSAPVSRAQAPPRQNADPSTFTVDDMLDVVNLRIADLSDDGRWLALAAATQRDRIGIDNYRFGDPTYIAPSLADIWIVDLQTAEKRRLLAARSQVQSLKWSPDGRYLAFLILKDGLHRPVIWERESGKLHPVNLPAGKNPANNTAIHWAPQGDRLYLSLQTDEWRKTAAERFQLETKGPIVFHSSREPFLAWDDVRRLAQIRSVAACEIQSGRTLEVLPEKRINSYGFTEDGLLVTYQEDITQKTDYDVIGGTESKVQVQPVGGGAARTILPTTKDRRLIWSKDGRHYAYAEKGSVFFASIDDKEARRIAGRKDEKTEAGKTGSEAKERDAETFTPLRLSRDGRRIVLSNKEGFWLMETAGGARELFIKRDEEDPKAPRYELIDWDPGGDNLYFLRSSRTEWQRSVLRYHIPSKRTDELYRDTRTCSNFTLSRDGRTFVFLCAENNRPPDLFAADADFKSVRRIVESNPQLAAKRLPRAELVSYYNVDGRKLYGVLYYPSDYVRGQKYPTIFIIYEDFFDDRFNGTTAVLNAHGYAVMQPSVRFETGYPGEAWLKAVTCAANKLVEMGIADPERLGVHGTSYGGYATNLLVTQTDRFKAAINISGKVNMISFYTDSPRLGVRNIHAPEKSQDRIGATLWQQPQKYIEHSAIMFADRIKTPLLLITGEQDSNVPARQAMEMYYALRRLGKEVAWVQYVNGGHGMPTTTVDELKDFHQRILDWYDSHLKGDLSKKKSRPTQGP